MLKFALFCVLVMVFLIKVDKVTTKAGKFLEFDVECPFLIDEEYAKRMIKGRCPPTSPSPPSTKPTPRPKTLPYLTRGAKKLLLKFISFGKKRHIFVLLTKNMPQDICLTEGSFLEIKCEGIKKKQNISWYYNGEKIMENLHNWRINVNLQGHLTLTPVLAKLDDGHFECYVDKEWRGSLMLTVETTIGAIMAGYLNFLMGSLFSLLFTIISIIYYIKRPFEKEAEFMEDSSLSIINDANKIERTKFYWNEFPKKIES